MTEVGLLADRPARVGAPEPASPASDAPWRRWAILLGWAALGASFVLEALAILTASRQWLVGRTADDAFYYLEIARRVDHGQGFSFDGIHATNGFHPLWQWILSGVGLAVPGQTGFIKADLLLCLVLVFAALLLVMRVVWRWLGPGPALMGALIVVHGRDTMSDLAGGMEGSVTVLALAGLLTALVWYFESPSRRRAVVVGIISAVVVLARLDMAAVIWIVPAAMVWRARNPRPLGGFALGALVGLPWAAWEWIRYHHVLTTSATVKQQQIAALARSDGGRLSHGYIDYVLAHARVSVQHMLQISWDSPGRDVPVAGTVLAVVLLTMAAVGLVAVSTGRARGDASPTRRGRRGPTGWALATVLVMLLVKGVFDLISAPTWADGWYLTSQRVAFTFLIGATAWIGVGLVARRWRGPSVAVGACLCLMAVPLTGSQLAGSRSTQVPTDSWQGQIDQAADWVVVHGPPGRYGASDAGLLGYRLNGIRTVVNLDGLVNDYRYDALVDRGATLRQELAATGVDVYVNRMPDRQVQQLDCARVLWRSAGPLGTTVVDGRAGDDHLYVLDTRRCR